MCAYSAVLDYWQRQWPSDQFQPYVPNTLPLHPFDDPEVIRKVQKLFEAAKEADKAAGQPDCEDPEKAKFEQLLLRRLDEIESKIQAAKSNDVPMDDLPLI